MKLLIVTLPDTNHTVACAYNESATETIECYVVEANEVNMHSIPARPGDMYRVPLTAAITANLVTALREMIMRAQGQ